MQFAFGFVALFLLAHAATAADVWWHRDNQNGFMIAFPAQWQTRAPMQPYVVAYAFRPDGLGSCSVTIGYGSAPRIPTAKWAEDVSPQILVDSMRSQFPDAVLVGGGKTYLSNLPAVFAELSYAHRTPAGAVPVRSYVVTTAMQGNSYGVVCNAPVAYFEQQRATFLAVASTFSLRFPPR